MASRATRRVTRRTAGLTVATLAGSVALAACEPQRARRAPQPVAGRKAATWAGIQEIEIWTTGYKPVVAAYKQLVEKFHEENPKVHIKTQVPKTGTARSLVPAVAGGAPPHAAEVNQPNTWSFAGKNIYVPLDNYIKRDKVTSAAVKDFYPGVLESVTWRGQLHFFLVGVSMEVWHVNKDYWQRAGLDLPQSGWTWDDLATKFGPALKQAVGEDGSPFMMELNEMYRMLAFMKQNGGDMFDKSGTKLTIAEPAAIEAVEYVRNLVVNEIAREKNPKKAKGGPERGGRKGVIGAKYTHGQNYRLERGDVALELEGMTRIPRYRKALGELMGVVPAITGKKQAAIFDSWCVGVVHNDDPVKMEAAYQWVSWLIKPENLMIYLQQRANLPPRKAILSLSNVAELWRAEPLIKDAMAYLNYGTTFPFTPATGEMRKGINAVLANVTRFGDPAAQTLQELQKVLMAQYGNLLQ